MSTGKSSSITILGQNWLDSTETHHKVSSDYFLIHQQMEGDREEEPYRLDSYDYPLPKELIAQFPSERRDKSRLMILNKRTGEIEHKRFFEIIEYLSRGDILVLNDTRVIPARLFGRRPTGGVVEVLLLEGKDKRWVCLINPSSGVKTGLKVTFDGGLEAKVTERREDGSWDVEFSYRGDIGEIIERVGVIPLPPYIKRRSGDRHYDKLDRERYQTVFARRSGAVAAPTAGLHFTEELLTSIKEAGIEVLYVTLHTGWGTFKPVREGDIRGHKMLPEYYEIGQSTFTSIRRAKEEGRRVVAVGTTATRALEASIQGGWDKPRLQGSTDLYIYPGFRFQVVDSLVTNFHLPRSSLLIMVSAFTGRERIMNAYQEAIREGYRFFSYGDAMMIA